MQEQLKPPPSKYDDDNEIKPFQNTVDLSQLKSALTLQAGLEDGSISDSETSILDVENEKRIIFPKRLHSEADSGTPSPAPSLKRPRYSGGLLKKELRQDELYSQVLIAQLEAMESKKIVNQKKEAMIEERHAAAAAEKNYWLTRASREHFSFFQYNGTSGPPLAVAGAPMQMGAAPMRMGAAPIQVGSAPMQLSTAPMQMGGPPVSMGGPPVSLMQGAFGGPPVGQVSLPPHII